MIAFFIAGVALTSSRQTADTAAFSFKNVDYIHRYSKTDLHEFTPKGQSDLTSWTDMVTINDYSSVKTGDDLAKTANLVLQTYKDNKAMVLKTNSTAKTKSSEAQHLIVVLFPKSEFIEASFARFLIENRKGHSIVYSHRIYGKKAGDAMSKWLLKNGEDYEKALMAIPTIPKH